MQTLTTGDWIGMFCSLVDDGKMDLWDGPARQITCKVCLKAIYEMDRNELTREISFV